MQYDVIQGPDFTVGNNRPLDVCHIFLFEGFYLSDITKKYFYVSIFYHEFYQLVFSLIYFSLDDACSTSVKHITIYF